MNNIYFFNLLLSIKVGEKGLSSYPEVFMSIIAHVIQWNTDWNLINCWSTNMALSSHRNNNNINDKLTTYLKMNQEFIKINCCNEILCDSKR